MISIIVPVYKAEPYLRKCIDSILLQTYQDFEIILVDDGSPDNCPQICDDYASSHDNIKVIHKSNGGLTSAWKCGLQKTSAQTEYVAFVDSDDCLDANCLAELAEAARNTDCDIVVGNIIKFYNEVYSELPNERNGLYTRDLLEEKIFPSILNDGTFQGRSIQVSRCAKLLRKNLILDNLCYCCDGTTYAEDMNITIPVFLDAQTVYFLKSGKGKYYYRMNPDSMLHAYDRKMLQSIDHVFPALERACRDKKCENMQHQLQADFLAASVQYYKNELQNPKGLRTIKENIAQYIKREEVQRAVREIDWYGYRKLNVIIIRSFTDFNWFNRNIVLPLLMLMKRSGIKPPS